MKVELHRSLAELESLRPAWTELAEHAGAGPFTRPWYAIPWAAELGQGAVTVVTVRSGTDLVAVAPLHVRRRAGLELVRFLGHGLGTVSELVLDPAHPGAGIEIWNAVLGRRRRVAELLTYPEHGAGLAALESRSGAFRSIPAERCPTICPGTSLDAFLASRRKSLRRVFRTSERLLAEARATLSAEVVTSVDALDGAIAEVRPVIDRAEAAHPRLHALEGRVGTFTRRLLAEAAEVGALRLFVLRVDDQPVACDFAFVSGDRLSCWYGRFDPDHRDLAPGHLNCREMVRHAIAEDLETVDLLIGDDPYKHRWSTGHYDTVDVLASGSAAGLATGRLLLQFAARARALADRVRHGGGGEDADGT
ncbi:hypothetical protein BH24ACT3_BH24ACT3_13370 [soil metagenome]